METLETIKQSYEKLKHLHSFQKTVFLQLCMKCDRIWRERFHMRISYGFFFPHEWEKKNNEECNNSLILHLIIPVINHKEVESFCRNLLVFSSKAIQA